MRCICYKFLQVCLVGDHRCARHLSQYLQQKQKQMGRSIESLHSTIDSSSTETSGHAESPTYRMKIGGLISTVFYFILEQISNLFIFYERIMWFEWHQYVYVKWLGTFSLS